ncbi:MAG: rRNA pseudouridine synthase [Oscillospiraceae bacterium]|nr:rRNA pseudouridine synthase [Oscillospiraceae bacterium]MBQ2791639.1 rRNA pseudouridine synthase [Oscillospiraceae bacterium]MBQ7082338.1 rRNA pseudouridine synthase [Oscillospiraceae bacterium]MBR2635830.1 rRNA pseudouridine synthase [Oscillospiraceae bacterium]MBR6607437.1 rRNA pseudouridine synthase [Oscillospiraceae bacterium]
MQKKNEPVRLQKVLSESGIMSRRKAEEMIELGKVTVNGRKAKIGQKVDPRRDIIAVEGKKVDTRQHQKKYYIALHKPRGYVTTMSDEMDRRCVADLVKDAPARVYPVGRLDRDSEGLLLMTNDGEFANKIMHPKFHINKTYRVTVRPDINDEQAMQLAEGVELDGVRTAPAQVMVLTKEPGRVVLQIVIAEGRNRQIRRMCEAVGLEVARLKRVSVGPVRLGMLPPGQWRMLTVPEMSALQSALKEEPEKRRDR